jgi:nitrous oxide reductase accessory protein NosL
MKSPHKALLALLIATFTLLATGCTSKTADETSIPWSRPSSWEGQVPGMGTTGDTSGNH